MIKQIAEWVNVLRDMTKEESDLIESILHWDQEKKSSFLIAKKLFENQPKKKKRKTFTEGDLKDE